MLKPFFAWLRQQGPWGITRLLLLDGPMFVVRVWMRLYLYVLAFGSLILWSILIWWLARAAWRAVSQ